MPKLAYRPASSAAPRARGPEFATFYEALVHAALRNPRRTAAGLVPFDLVATLRDGVVAERVPATLPAYYRRYPMPGPYAVLSQRAFPDLRLEYATRTLDEAEALLAQDGRVRSWRDHCVVAAGDRKLLARFQEPELRSLFRRLATDQQKEPETYVQLIDELVKFISRAQVEFVPEALVKQYRRTAPTQPEEIVMAEVNGSTPTETLTRIQKTAGKSAGAPKQKAAAKSAKVARTPTKGSAKNRQKTANKEAVRGVKDPLGRPGTLFRFMADLIMSNKSNEAVAAAAAKKFPESKSTEVKHVSWARFALKRRGVKVPELKE